MYCRKCGAEIRREAKFCPKCGTPITHNCPPSVEVNHAIQGQLSIPSTMALLEGVLSVFQIFIMLFMPAIRFSYFVSADLTVMQTITGFSKLSQYTENLYLYVFILAVMMITATVSAVFNAVQCFSNVVPHQAKHSMPLLESIDFSGGVSIYAACLLLILGYCSHESYGIIRSTGWNWLLLLVGVVSMTIHELRMRYKQIKVAE